MEPNSTPCLLDELRLEMPHLSTESAVVVLCEQLLQAAVVEPPIAVERVASLRGIARVTHADQPWAGMLVPGPRNLVVTVRAADSYERQRFTVCHEIGHTFFDGFYQQTSYRCNGEKTRLEQLCDFAATELLMPRRFFASDLESTPFDLDGVEELASAYQASIEATALRTVDLRTEPSMLLVLRCRHKPAEAGKENAVEPTLRLDYCHASGDWPFALAHKSVKTASPLLDTFDGELVDTDDADIDELFSNELGRVELHAKQYGSDGRVLALVRRKRSHRG